MICVISSSSSFFLFFFLFSPVPLRADSHETPHQPPEEAKVSEVQGLYSATALPLSLQDLGLPFLMVAVGKADTLPSLISSSLFVISRSRKASPLLPIWLVYLHLLLSVPQTPCICVYLGCRASAVAQSAHWSW